MTMVWQNVVNALIGVWFIMSPFALGYNDSPFRAITSYIGGAILLVLGGNAALSEKARRQAWPQYVNALVGIWFILAPSVLSFAGRAGDHWTSLIGGIVVLVLSGWVLFGLSKTQAVRVVHSH
jgi:SPW repeat